MKPLICITLLTFWCAQANDMSKGWSDWMAEGQDAGDAGKYSDAAQAFRQALVLAEGSDGGNRMEVGIHDALASVYAEAGQYMEAEHVG
jgi:hypothetical protein